MVLVNLLRHKAKFVICFYDTVYIYIIMNRFIYSGTISIDNNEISLVDILIASDELELLEVYQQLEKRLLENESAWKLPKDFIKI